MALGPFCRVMPAPTRSLPTLTPTGIHLLDLSGPTPCHVRVATSSPLSIASALCFLPLPDTGEPGAPLSGLLVVASACGATQTLGVPRAAAAAPAAPHPPWPMLQSALIPSLAPALCVAAIPAGGAGPGGLPEAQALVGCGRAPRGRLARVRSGVGLRPFVLDGPELPVRRDWGGACFCLLPAVRPQT